jgi:hypothetical protein
MSPAARYVTSDAFGAPGIYVRELTPSRPIRATVAGKRGVIGQCVRGPVGRAIEITSYARFAEVFGERDYGAGGAIIGEVWKSLINKPFSPMVVVRAAAAAAVTASFTLETAAGGAGTAVLRVDASSPGIWGNDVRVKVSAASDGDANHFNLEVKYLSRAIKYQNLDISGTNDNTALVIGDDDGRLVTLTKLAAGRPVNNAVGVDGGDTEGFINLGETVAAFTSVAGTEGTIADSDFTGTGGPLEVINGYKGIGPRYVAGRSNSAIKAKILTLAASLNEGLWLICPDASNTAQATVITEAGTNRHKRIAYEHNHPITLDPTTAQKITTEPHAWMASDLSQLDPDGHPGVEEASEWKVGIVGLTFEGLQPGDYDALDAAGINSLERNEEGGIGWVSGVTTSLVNNDRTIDGRRTKDFLISGIVSRLKGSKYKPNTVERRESDRAAVVGWLTGLARSGRYVDRNESGSPMATVANGSDVNTRTGQAAGIQKMLVRAALIPMNLVLNLLMEVGTDVTFTELD